MELENVDQNFKIFRMTKKSLKMILYHTKKSRRKLHNPKLCYEGSSLNKAQKPDILLSSNFFFFNKNLEMELENVDQNFGIFGMEIILYHTKIELKWKWKLKIWTKTLKSFQ